MKNYEAVHQWAATVNLEKGLVELEGLKVKYPWLKCDEALEALHKMNKDLPDIIKIIKLQEKQNAMHREFVSVNQLADEAIVNAIKVKFDL